MLSPDWTRAPNPAVRKSETPKRNAEIRPCVIERIIVVHPQWNWPNRRRHLHAVPHGGCLLFPDSRFERALHLGTLENLRVQLRALWTNLFGKSCGLISEAHRGPFPFEDRASDCVDRATSPARKCWRSAHKGIPMNRLRPIAACALSLQSVKRAQLLAPPDIWQSVALKATLRVALSALATLPGFGIRVIVGGQAVAEHATSKDKQIHVPRVMEMCPT